MAFDLSSIELSTQLPPRIVLYGVPGIGKTTFAADMPDPIFIPVEDGFGQLKVKTFPQPKTYSEVLDMVDALITEDHNHKTLVIDGLGKLETLIWAHVVETVKNDKGAKVNRIEDYGWAKGYKHALTEWGELLKALDHLRKTKAMSVCLIGHSSILKFEPPDTEPYDRYELSVHKNASAEVRAWSDVTLFANYKVTVVSGGGSNDKKRGVGKGDRFLFTTEQPAFNAKNRYRMDDRLPLDWFEVAKFIGAVAVPADPPGGLGIDGDTAHDYSDTDIPF